MTTASGSGAGDGIDSAPPPPGGSAGSLLFFGGMRRLPETVAGDCLTLPTAVPDAVCAGGPPPRGSFLRLFKGDETKFPEDCGCRE